MTPLASWMMRQLHLAKQKPPCALGLELGELQNRQASFYINTKEVWLKDELDRIKEFSGIFKSTSKLGYKDVFISAFRVENELGDTLCYVQMKREAKEYLRIIEKSQSGERTHFSACAKRPSYATVQSQWI